MVEIGKFNTLTVVKLVDFGVYLDGEERGEILMPKEYVPDNCSPDDEVKAFIYFDSEDRIVATTEKPYVKVGEFAFFTAGEGGGLATEYRGVGRWNCTGRLPGDRGGERGKIRECFGADARSKIYRVPNGAFCERFGQRGWKAV